MPVGNFPLWQLAGFHYASWQFFIVAVGRFCSLHVLSVYCHHRVGGQSGHSISALRANPERRQSEGRAKAHWKDAHTERQPPVIEHFRQPKAYALDIGHSTPQSYKSAVYVFEPPIPLYFPSPFIYIHCFLLFCQNLSGEKYGSGRY